MIVRRSTEFVTNPFAVDPFGQAEEIDYEEEAKRICALPSLEEFRKAVWPKAISGPPALIIMTAKRFCMVPVASLAGEALRRARILRPNERGVPLALWLQIRDEFAKLEKVKDPSSGDEVVVFPPTLSRGEVVEEKPGKRRFRPARPQPTVVRLEQQPAAPTPAPSSFLPPQLQLAGVPPIVALGFGAILLVVLLFRGK